MRNYFCGWYYRCQSDSQTLAVIPAIHTACGQQSCSIQLITDTDSWNIPFPASAFQKNRAGIQIGKSHFGRQGISLHLYAPGISAVGSLSFGPFTPIRYDIMGPFRYVPFMECRHSVFSMQHTVTGEIRVNGNLYSFRNASGYLEGDRGRSFPKEYAWTQCSFPEGAWMLSVADIPFGGFRFTGVIGVILLKGREYRIATYLGARVMQIRNGEIVIQQGSLRLTVRRLENAGHPLCAPTGGAMTRTIREQAACRVFYQLRKGEETLLEFTAPRAAFEYEYPC